MPHTPECFYFNIFYSSMAEDLKKSGRKNFLINCLDEEILDLLYLFQNFGMITTGYSYFFTSVDYNTDIPSFKYSGADIIKVSEKMFQR